jgi:hypothetical protein
MISILFGSPAVWLPMGIESGIASIMVSYIGKTGFEIKAAHKYPRHILSGLLLKNQPDKK